jgi:predicted AAA+ superfamily ATPase
MTTALNERPESPPTGEGLTYEKVWAMFQETDRQIKAYAEKWEKDREEREKDREEWELIHKETQRAMGKLGNRFGELVEHLVAPNIKEKFNKLGFCFTRSARDAVFDDPKDTENCTEVDILLENGDIVIAVEVKSKPDDKDVIKHIRRLEILRNHADKKQDKRRYQGAIAGAIINADVRNFILKNGFYVIEQSGDTVQINIPPGFKAREW